MLLDNSVALFSNRFIYCLQKNITAESFASFLIILPSHIKLQIRTEKLPNNKVALTYYSFFHCSYFRDYATNREIYSIIQENLEGKVLGDSLGKYPDEKRMDLLNDLIELWRRRMIIIRPSSMIS